MQDRLIGEDIHRNTKVIDVDRRNKRPCLFRVITKEQRIVRELLASPGPDETKRARGNEKKMG